MFNTLFKRLSSNRAIICRRSNVTWHAAPLESRVLTELNGKDSRDYLQGLITNDVRHLEDESNHAIYAFMLNHLGRIIGDLFVYRASDPDQLLVECDERISNVIRKNLTIHKLKKKVSVVARNNLKVWSIFPSELTDTDKIKEDAHKYQVAVNDPRLPGRGLFRLVTEGDIASADVTRHSVLDHLETVSLATSDDYKRFRMRNGIGEGIDDIKPENAFPLESNGDYLNAISFFKGCYVGQELTARTYHTGVTRKRLMPLEFDAEQMKEVVAIEVDHKLTDQSGRKRLGKLRSRFENLGLGLAYIDEVPKFNNELYLEKIKMTTRRPCWWPVAKSDAEKAADSVS